VSLQLDNRGYWHRTILDAEKLRTSFRKFAKDPTDDLDPTTVAMEEFLERNGLRASFPYNHQ
jgi:hypothetical protein